jgi:curli biogenesis system outer membrane secretion channel CsgG
MKKRWTRNAWLVAGLVVLTFAGYGFLGMERVTQPKAREKPQKQQVAYGGKARIAVANFKWGVGHGSSMTTVTDSEGRTTTVEHQDYATGLRDMLVDALMESGRYEVLERGEMAPIKQEVGLTEGGWTGKSGKRRGNIVGADLLVTATVTGWEPNISGIGGNVRVPFGPFGSSQVGVGLRNSSMAMVIRIFDTSTSRVLASKTIDGQAKDFGFSTGGSTYPMSGGLGAFSRTPMEKAIRVCIAKGVEAISQATPKEYCKY